MEYTEDYWKNKKQWIDSQEQTKELTDDEYWEQQDNIREVMELNMWMYGKW